MQELQSHVLLQHGNQRRMCLMYGIDSDVPVAEWTDVQLRAIEAQILGRDPPTSGPRFERLEEIQKVLKDRAAALPIMHQQV